MRGWILPVLACLFLVLATHACKKSDSSAAEAEAAPGLRKAAERSSIRVSEGRRLTGPFTHENLSVHLVVADDPRDAEFITLAEGLESGFGNPTTTSLHDLGESPSAAVAARQEQ